MASGMTVDIDWGVGIIKRGNWGSPLDRGFNPFYDYKEFDKRRTSVLNLINEEQFNATLKDFFKYK